MQYDVRFLALNYSYTYSWITQSSVERDKTVAAVGDPTDSSNKFCMYVEETRNAYRNLIGKPERKGPLEGGIKCKYRNNNKTYLRGTACDMKLTDLTQSRIQVTR
jgi:hypothetical protein